MDLYECRIQAHLYTMSHTLQLTLPQNEAWTTAHFLHKASAQSEVGGNVLSSCSKRVEDAVVEMLELLRTTAVLPTINSFDSEETIRSKIDEMELFESHCQDLFAHFRYRNLEALIASVRWTLDNLRRCITTSISRSARPYATISTSQEDPTACFQADLILSIPNIIMQPSLEEMQNTVNQAVQFICEVGQHVRLWTPPVYTAIPYSTSPHNTGGTAIDIHDKIDVHIP